MRALRALRRRLDRRAGGARDEPQLLMWYGRRQPPALPALPPGYVLRPFAPGDESAWAALLDANGQLGRWDRARVEGELAGALVRQFFAARGAELVACAGIYDRCHQGQACWELGWIAVHPRHAGRGLGAQVTARALAQALCLPARPIYLRTDDFRLPALKTYLKLGFVADGGHPSYRRRWECIFAQLGASYQSYRPGFIQEG